MVNVWIALLACTLAAFIGYCWGRDVTYQRVARNVVRLEALVPSPGLLRRAAEYAEWLIAERPGRMYSGLPKQENVDAKALLALAARIEAAGEGAVPVPVAWEQTPTRRE